MKNKINIDVETLRIIYKKYKKHITYGGIIFVCIIVFLLFVISNILQLPSIKETRDLEIKKRDALLKNLKTISLIDSSILDSEFEIATQALPEDKDFEGIINAISIAASKAGVSLNDYDFEVGSITDAQASVGGYPFLKLVLSVRADPETLTIFLDNLATTIPLSEVINIEHNSGLSSVTTVFYYKPYSPSNATDEAELNQLTAKEKELLDTISGWNSSFSPIVSEASSNSTSSAF